jgi:hypothetical protein
VFDANAQGEYKISTDGSDDENTATLSVDSEPNILWCFTIETTATDAPIGGWDESGSFGLIIARMDGANSTGACRVQVGDGSSTVNVESTTLINDGSKYRIAVGIVENSEVFVAVNSTKEDSASFGTKGPVSDSYYEGFHPLGPGTYLSMDIDDGIVYTDASQQTIDDDYALQPWS